MNDAEWCVYTLSDSRYPEIVRYVGITANQVKRLRQHKRPKSSDTSHRAKWIRSVLRDGGDISLSVVELCTTSGDAECRERDLIAKFRASGFKLVNGTDGGGGLLNPTKEVRDRMSKSISATRTPEFRRRLSVTMTEGATPERRSAISIAVILAKSDPESIERDRVAKRRKPPLSNNTGKYKGVSFFKAVGKWGGRIKIDGKSRHLGLFPTPELAALAYDRAAFEAWNGDCYLNFSVAMTASQENMIHGR